MAETSGFFQSQWDDDLKNPITEQYTGWWDRDYYWKQFCDYFALFIGNGVFGSPTNQLKVIPGTGLSVIVSAGWAFINGAWYHNDQNKEIVLASNGQSSGRVDSIKVRFSDSDRTITVGAYTGDTSVIRGETVYELKIAEVIVQPNAVTISATDITDTRTDEEVCGLVKGLMEVETTADLFAQYEAQFNAWFDTVKDQVTGDLAIRLQNEFEQINQEFQQYHRDIETYEGNVVIYQQTIEQEIAQFKTDVNQQVSEFRTEATTTLGNIQSSANTAIGNVQTSANTSIGNVEQAGKDALDDFKTEAQESIDEANALVADYVDKDYVIAEQELVFVNNVCNISDSKVTSESLIDVYFTEDTINVAAKAQIIVDSSNGLITFTASRTPSGTVKAKIRVRVR